MSDIVRAHQPRKAKSLAFILRLPPLRPNCFPIIALCPWCARPKCGIKRAQRMRPAGKRHNKAKKVRLPPHCAPYPVHGFEQTTNIVRRIGPSVSCTYQVILLPFTVQHDKREIVLSHRRRGGENISTFIAVVHFIYMQLKSFTNIDFTGKGFFINPLWCSVGEDFRPVHGSGFS